MSIPILPKSHAPPCSYCTPERLKKKLSLRQSMLTFQEMIYPDDEVKMTREVRSICSNCIIKMMDIIFRPKIEVTG